MEGLKDGYYSEVSAYSPGQAMSIEIEKVLHHEKSPYQDILLLKSKAWGNLLVLDGAIQCSERDEFAYQEMIAHLPLFAHPNPKSVLVIGGGDGGVLREIVKHNGVESITICELDERVVKLSTEYLPEMAKGFKDPRVNLQIGDGLAYMKQNKASYDVIITDSSDPVGPAETLFGKEYYELVKSCLKPGGIACSQAESMWLHLHTIEAMFKFCKDIFPSVEYAWSSVPTYPAGAIGYLILGDSSCSVPKNTGQTTGEFRYWTPSVHSASFALPKFVLDRLN
eukprot:TRINITY_DN414_c0_g1_i1.p1 TRINITY_DN414_c0_g1~~TRINITY_DN414_c0_g1_i1.p1  ORF type:complete len:281 (-),score=81.03 TRINITY_DN414_c0_g1_i1:27-869(-)